MSTKAVSGSAQVKPKRGLFAKIVRWSPVGIATRIFNKIPLIGTLNQAITSRLPLIGDAFKSDEQLVKAQVKRAARRGVQVTLDQSQRLRS